MKLIHSILMLCLVAFASNCDNGIVNSHNSIKVKDSFRLPGIPSKRTFLFVGGDVYYQSMDAPFQETFKCFSLQKKALVWNKSVTHTGINSGVIASTGEYLVPTLSDTVYLIDKNGNSRTLLLTDRCKITPLSYKSTFVLQDRGVGLKCFDTETLKELWLIKQSRRFTMSQPILSDGNIIYVLDDETIQSSKMSNGQLNWRVSLADTFGLHDLYGSYKNMAFILSTNLQNKKQITAIDCKTGNVHWQTDVDNEIDELDRDMGVNADQIFCKGANTIFTYSIGNGEKKHRYNYKSRIATNIVSDNNGNILFGLEDNTLMRIGVDGKESLIGTFSNKLERLYWVNDSLFLYSYPHLLLLHY